MTKLVDVPAQFDDRSFDQFAAKYRSDPAWRFHELKTGHDAMILMPGEVSRLLQAT